MKRKYIAYFFTFILFVFMWILFGWNTDNADYGNYLDKFNQNYQNLDFNTLDFGYFWMNLRFNMWGFDFSEFRIILSGISLLLLYFSILKWSCSPFICALVYFVTVFFVDAVQIRNFFGYVLVICALPFLITGSFRGKLMYAFFVLCASSIHFSLFFYMIFLFVNVQRKSSPWMIFCITFCVAIFSSSLLKPMSSILEINDNGKMDNYTTVFSYPSLIISSFILLLNFLVVKHFSLKKLSLNNKICVVGFSAEQYDNFVYNINVVLFCLIPFLPMNMTFLRLFRNMYIFNIIYIYNKVGVSKNKLSLLDCGIIFLYILFAFIYFVGININTVILPVIENNSF